MDARARSPRTGKPHPDIDPETLRVCGSEESSPASHPRDMSRGVILLMISLADRATLVGYQGLRADLLAAFEALGLQDP